jgi:hypothetical protein
VQNYSEKNILQILPKFTSFAQRLETSILLAVPSYHVSKPLLPWQAELRLREWENFSGTQQGTNYGASNSSLPPQEKSPSTIKW